MLFEENVCIPQEDQAEDWLTVFIRRDMRARPEDVGRMPKVVFQGFQF